MKRIKVRFAPSPTGHLHIGGVRTALYCYAMAKKNHGSFMVRLEDTDRNRFVEGSEEEVFDMLTAYKLLWDERTRQSDRLPIYKEYAEKLVDLGAAYYCFMTEEEIAAEKKIAEENKEMYKFKSPYRDSSVDEARKRINMGEKYVIRQKVPKGREIIFEDNLQGKVIFRTDEINDTVLLKTDGFPTYHLAAHVDDHLMEITHVFRGVEWLPSSPKHILLYEAFGWEMPEFYHLPLILDPDGGKLSKRRGAVSAYEFLKDGYVVDAVLNFLMLLGWAPDMTREFGEKEREIFSLTDFIEMFDLKDLNKNSPIFNREKLIWFNQKYLQTLSPDEFENRFANWLKEYTTDEDLKTEIIDKGPDFLQKVLEQVRSRVKILSEIPEMIKFFYFEPGIVDLKTIKQLKNVDDKNLILAVKDFMLELDNAGNIEKLKHEEWEMLVRKIADSYSLKHGQLFMALRVMVTGTPFSPPLFETMTILGNDLIKSRIEKYI